IRTTSCSSWRTRRPTLLTRSRLAGAECPLADNDGPAADFDLRYLFAVEADGDVDLARTPHAHALIADDLSGQRLRPDPVVHEVAAERTAGGAGRRVFDDPEFGREHAAVRGHAPI